MKISDKKNQRQRYRSMSLSELKSERSDLMKKMFHARIQKAARQDFKGHALLDDRRSVARIMTAIREREIERGLEQSEQKG